MALAVLLALVAVAGSGYVGWRQWQQERGLAADSAARAGLGEQVGKLQGGVEQLGSLRDRLTTLEQANHNLDEQWQGLSQRSRTLEDAVAKLSEKTLSGHDSMLLDEAESLLRMADERYRLFHDAADAAAAYGLADQALAAVNDGAYSGVRQSLAAERVALLKSQPSTEAATLDALTALRAGVQNWPLKPLDAPADGAHPGVWWRIRAALAGVISVRRDNGAPLAVADARFARELVALDLAQAQAAVLAHDGDAYAGALGRATAGIDGQFNVADAQVQQGRAELVKLAQARPAAAVELGGALTQLRNQRAVHALHAGAAEPAHSVSQAAPGAEGSAPAGSSTAVRP